METDKEFFCCLKVKATRCNRERCYQIQHTAAVNGAKEIQGVPPEGDDSVTTLLANQSARLHEY